MSYDSPLLPIPEILILFRESNINVTEIDMKNPDPRRWHDIYAQIFEVLTCKPIEKVIQSMFRVERMQTAYNDLFEEGFAQMAFTHCMQTVMGLFGFPNFSVKDVIQPNTKRLSRLSSVFLNAVRHIQMTRQYSQNMLAEIQASKGQFESVLNHNRKLKELLADAKKTQQQREAESQKVQKEFDNEQQACAELYKVQEEERRAVDELKFRVAELDTEKGNLKQQLIAVQQEAEKMSHKIVQSPKRFKKDLERFKNKVDDLKAELGKKEQALSENRLLLEHTTSKLTAIEKAGKLSKEVQGDLDKENEVDAEIRRLAEEYHEQKEFYGTLCLQIEVLTEKLSIRQDQKHKLLSQIDLKEQSFHQQLTDLKLHKERLQEKCKNLEMELPQIVATTKSCCKELAKLEQDLEDKKHENKREIEEAITEVLAMEDFASRELSDLYSIL